MKYKVGYLVKIRNWEEMEKQHDQWWRTRLHAASELYHMYRIDHVVGFFRIWAIPEGQLGREGRYLPDNPKTWLAHGEKIMRMMLQTSPLLPIGEDLGTVPAEVRQKLRELAICGTKVMRLERRWEGDKSFIPIENYEPISMTTVSTHDSGTLQLWWRQHPEEAADFCRFKGWDYTVPLSHDCQRQILWDSHHSRSLLHINPLQEYLALFPDLVWPNPEDERVNVPGIISEKNWSYRFRPTLEEIITHKALTQAMQEVLQTIPF